VLGQTGLDTVGQSSRKEIYGCCFVLCFLSSSFGFKKILPQGVTKGPERLADLPKVTQAF
jgi:hypothetical protein